MRNRTFMLWAFALGCIAGAARACAGGANAGSLAAAEGGASLDDEFDAVNGAGLGHGGRRDLLDAADELRGVAADLESSCEGSVLDVLEKNADLSILAAVLQDTGLASTLKAPGPWTILAPADAAFEPLIDQLNNFTPDMMRSLLLAHIIRGGISSEKLTQTTTLRTAGDDTINVTRRFFTEVKDGKREIASRITFNDAPLVEGPVKACDGYVYALGAIISTAPPVAEVPEDGPLKSGTMEPEIPAVATTEAAPSTPAGNVMGCLMEGARGGLVNGCDDAPASVNAVANPNMVQYSIPIRGGTLEVEIDFGGNRYRNSFSQQSSFTTNSLRGRNRNRNPYNNNNFAPQQAPAAAGAASTEEATPAPRPQVRRQSNCAFVVPEISDGTLCLNTCPFANDGTCDDFSICDIGTDCADCGPREGVAPPPALIDVAKGTLRSVLELCKPISGPMLRFGFHDAGTFDARRGTGGANGSIRFRNEINDNKNNNIERIAAVMSDVKSELDARAADLGGQTISLADLIQLGASEAVKFTGGPDIPVKFGRVDAAVPDSTRQLPAANIRVNQLRPLLQPAGFSDADIVAMTGSHTIGAQSTNTPETFDNRHFLAVQQRRARLQSDNILNNDRSFDRIVDVFAADENTFREAFVRMYTKVSLLGTANLNLRDEL